MNNQVDLSLSPRVLVAEDEAIVALDVQTTLESLGYDVVGVVHTGEEAVEAAKTLSPDVVLLDIRMPGLMDGVDAGRVITERHGIPIVFLTAHSDTNTLQRAKESGPYGYLVKPVDEREIRTTIELALYRHSLERMAHEDARQWEALFARDAASRVICTRNGTVLECNASFARLLGFESAEAAREGASLPPEITDPDLSPAAQELEGRGIVEGVELRLPGRDGGQRRVIGAAHIQSVRGGRVWEIGWSFIPLPNERRAG